jgi:translation initiation factor 5A
MAATTAQHEYETFESVDSGASLTYPMTAGALKQGGYVCIQGHACKITDLDVAQPGKHGHSKVSITAVDVFSGKTRMDAAPTSHNVMVPFVTTAMYQLLDIGRDGELSLMDDEGETRQDLDLPAEDRVGDKIRARFASGKTLDLRVLRAMSMEKILSFKEECGK